MVFRNEENEQMPVTQTVKQEILKTGEKVHIIHRRHFEKEPHRHFVGVVDAYEHGVARVTGYVFAVDPGKAKFLRRPEVRTRLVSVVSGEILLNVLPPSVDIEKIQYHQEPKALRVTDGSAWHLDISELAWS
jgi:hypothetical protein